MAALISEFTIVRHPATVPDAEEVLEPQDLEVLVVDVLDPTFVDDHTYTSRNTTPGSVTLGDCGPGNTSHTRPSSPHPEPHRQVHPW
ncbi:hypothetical protein E2C01_100133 [Portunus trituberculatus]|uniref:Uncharacterized protein n=1 Tax=Portunus trituberculatus TaxID=210409 RepID=A0A5B7K788_PORTR|nr:hypothetical protein [Portunus trituberculatus]